MKMFKVSMLAVICLTLLTGWGFKKDSPDQQRKNIDQATSEVLVTLDREVPGAKAYLEDSVGYAVFSSLGINVLLLSTASGKGVAHYKNSGKKAYMSMFSAGAGIGLGVKNFRLVFVFATQDAMDQFVNEGWTAGAQADAAAAVDDKGDAASLAMDVSPGVRLFQMTDSGLALQATIQGTKYWKDDDLN